MEITEEDIKVLLQDFNCRENFDLINTLELKDIHYIVKSGIFENSDVRQISINALLKAKRSEIESPEAIFFQKFKSLYELDKVVDINNLDNEFFEYINKDFFNKYFKFFYEYRLENFFTKNELNIISQNINFKDYIDNLTPLYKNYLMKDEVIYLLKIKLDSLSENDKKEIGLIYLNKLYELFKDDFNKFQVQQTKKIKNIIDELNINEYLTYMNIENFNEMQMAMFEFVFNEDDMILTDDFKNKYFNKKITFYKDKKNIIIDHLCSINSSNLLLEKEMIKALKSNKFKQSTTFYMEDKTVSKNIVKEIVKNGYTCSAILDYTFFNNDLNAIDYFKNNIHIINENYYLEFFHPYDLLYLKIIDKKCKLFEKGFYHFFKNNFETIVNENGRIKKEGKELIYINFSI